MLHRKSKVKHPVIADIRQEHISALIATFPPDESYMDVESIRDATKHCYPFNILQPTTYSKVNIIPLAHELMVQSASARCRCEVYDKAGHTAVFISSEDLGLAKWHAHRETRLERHL